MPDIPHIDIRPDHWDIVRSILQKHVPQYDVWAFGSRAQWTAKEYSDLDLAVITDKPLSLEVSASLSDDFSESDLPWKVDVVDWATTSESFRKIIERDKVVVQEGKKSLGVANEWPMVRLGDYVHSNLGKMLDAQKNKGIPLPYLGNSNVRWGSFDLNDLALMKFEEGEEERYGILNGDLIVCEGGEPGRCAIWREQVPDMKIQKALHRIRSKNGLNNYYLFYWFMLAGRAGWLEPFFTGTTIKHLTGKALNELKVPLPPMKEQRAIAHILGTLDDKIELNCRRNQTLEAMARALFQDWFIDFGPVRLPAGRQAPKPDPRPGVFFVYALECENDSIYIGHAEDVLRRYQEHLAGRGAEWTKRHPPRRIAYWEEQPSKSDAIAREKKLKSGSGREWLKEEIARRDLLVKNGPYPPHILDLFPDRLDDEGKPEGWRCSTIGTEVTVCGGSTPSTREAAYWEGGEHHWATPKDLSALKFPVLLDTDRKITDAGIEKISSGLLPVGTVLLSSRAPIGYLAIAEVPTAINQGFIAMKCDGNLPNVFVLFWCRENMDLILGNANGSTFQEISKSNFRPIPVIVPPEPILKAFRELTEPLYRHIVENERESKALGQLRDTLLPKLISGELRIADAAAFIERVEAAAT